MAKLHFGWFVPPLGIAESDYVPLPIQQQAEVLPVVAQYFDSLWVPDHLYAFDERTAPFLECWTTITWLAARFPTMQVGAIVMSVGFRPPALLAKMAATLQALSGGRLIMGIGAGWRAEEYPAYGYEFPRTPVRVRQLEEALEIFRRMWTEEAPSFQGEYFQIAGAYCAPRPVPVPPLMIGGSGEQLMLPLIARRADIWDFYHGATFDTLDLAEYTHKRNLLHEHARAAGRDPATITLSLTIGPVQLPDSATDSVHWRDHLRRLADAGITQFILDCGDHITATDPIRRLGEDVIAPLTQDRA